MGYVARNYSESAASRSSRARLWALGFKPASRLSSASASISRSEYLRLFDSVKRCVRRVAGPAETPVAHASRGGDVARSGPRRPVGRYPYLVFDGRAGKSGCFTFAWRAEGLARLRHSRHGLPPLCQGLNFRGSNRRRSGASSGRTGKTSFGKAENAMTDTAPAAAREPRRGREARRTARAKASLASIPYITRKIPLTELVSEEGLATIERNAETLLEEVGIEFRDFPRALELFRGAGCDIKGERVRFPRGLARRLCATTPSQYVQHARNPERNVLDRRRRDGVCPQLRLAVRPRPRQGPPLRHARGLPEFRQARLSEPLHPPFRRHGVRAGRSAGQQAAFRDGVRASQIFGQAVHGLGDQARARRGQRAHLRASVRRGVRARQHGA